MRRSFSSLGRSVAGIAREQRKLEQLQLRMAATSAREAERASKQLARQAAADRVATGEAEAADQSDDLQALDVALRGILRSVKEQRVALDFNAMQVKPKIPVFDSRGLDRVLTPPNLEDRMPPPLTFWTKMVPGATEHYEARVEQAHAEFQEASEAHEVADKQRLASLAALEATYRAQCDAAEAEATAKNAEITAFQLAYKALDRDAVIEYFSMVFEADELFEPLPNFVRVTYDSDSKQLIIERQLPTLNAIPDEASFKYVKKTDEIVPVARKVADRRELYADVLSQVTLRSLRVALRADYVNSVAVFTFNGFVDTIDPRTGTKVKPTLISVTAARDALEAISFDHVEPTACLRGLKALVSRNAHELEPVRPLVVFDMVDRRFVDKTDVLSDLESRPNLAELTPSEFEALMTNLFEKMGLETRLTQASRDGGVDCVAWDMRPVVGGKVVIQAKRYRNTVGVSAVRDLYGTMLNEGAAKGILVATSGYGDTSYEFAKNKPIELISGSNLLSLLDEYAHVKARIDFPITWVDEIGALSP